MFKWTLAIIIEWEIFTLSAGTRHVIYDNRRLKDQSKDGAQHEGFYQLGMSSETLQGGYLASFSNIICALLWRAGTVPPHTSSLPVSPCLIWSKKTTAVGIVHFQFILLFSVVHLLSFFPQNYWQVPSTSQLHVNVSPKLVSAPNPSLFGLNLKDS